MLLLATVLTLVLSARLRGAGTTSSNAVDVSTWVLRGALGTNVFRHSYNVFAMQFSPDGKTLMTAGGHKITLWDVATGARVREFAESNWITHAVISGDGRRILSCSGYHADHQVPVTVWDVATGRRVFREEKAHYEDTCGGAISADGKKAVSCAEKGDMRVWDVEAGSYVGNPTVSGASFANFSSDGRLALFVGYPAVQGESGAGRPKTCAVLVEVETGRTVWSADYSNGVRLVAFVSPDGSNVAVQVGGPAAGEVGPVEIRAVAGRNDRPSVRLEESAGASQGRSMFHPLVFSADGTCVAGFRGLDATRVAGARDGELLVWNRASGAVVRRIALHREWVPSLCLSADGRLVAAADGATIRIWDVETGEQTDPARPNLAGVTSLGSSSNGPAATVVAGSDCGQVFLWALESGRLLSRTQVGNAQVGFMSWDGDSRIAWCAGCPCRKVELSGGKVLATVGPTDGTWAAAAISSDEKSILVMRTHPFNDLALWDVASGKSVPIAVENLDCGDADMAFGEEPAGLYVAAGQTFDVWSPDGRKLFYRNELDSGLQERSFSEDKRFLMGAIDREETNETRLVLYGLPAPLTAERRQKIRALADQLGNTEFKVRDRVTQALKAEGWGAVGILRDLAGSDDPEVACRAQEIIEAATNAGLLRLVAELPVRDAVRQISFDPSAGVWAAFLYSRAILEVTHLLVGTFSAQPPSLTLVREFEVGENANVHCLLPDGQGVLCGNKDGTILWFGPPPAKTK